MARPFMGFAFVLLLVAAFELSTVSAVQGIAGRGRQLLTKIDCGHACTARCEVASFNDRCLKYCGICCRECNCVPSGHHGHKDECACYRDKKSSKNKPKCP